MGSESALEMRARRRRESSSVRVQQMGSRLAAGADAGVFVMTADYHKKS
jgi:hypothetical protein